MQFFLSFSSTPVSFQIERKIYYEEVEGLVVEWLVATSALVLNLCAYKHIRRARLGNYRALNEVA